MRPETIFLSRNHLDKEESIIILAIEDFPKQSEPLKDGDKIIIVGGGPAGSFFALHLLRDARISKRRIDVTILEKKKPLHPIDDPWIRRGCNFCAGGISPRLHSVLKEEGICIPQEIIQEEFSYIWIQGLWKNVPLKVTKEARMLSVFRGSLPHKRTDSGEGFDALLLRKAIDEGAHILSEEAQSVQYDPSGRLQITIKKPPAGVQVLNADFVAVSTGINADKDQNESSLFRSIKKLNPDYQPVKVRKSLIFELSVGRDYLMKYMNKEVYFIEYGSKSLPLEHIALIPKRDFLTIALIGKRIDEALPGDKQRIIKEFFLLPHIQRILPHLHKPELSIACSCSPLMTVGPAKFPFADRLALIGDVAGTRLYKDGLYAAHITAKILAQTVLFKGMDKRTLASEYGVALKWLAEENRYGSRVFQCVRLTFGTALLSRIIYQAFATEMKLKEESRRPLGKVLYKVAFGTANYREIFREMFGFPVMRSILIGGFLITLRNILTERFFGLKWGEYGRYPTVILKDKWNYFKESISAPLGIKLDRSPDFERMYAIKIRAPAAAIYRELGKFGDEERHFFHLRFAKAQRISGAANKVGSTIKYSIIGLASPVEMRLARCIPNKALLYEVSEKFANHGILLFDINPTKDGNNRFVIYTAFDYKKGKTLGGKIFWRLFKLLFPAYIHDVVWNHALCSIKEETERKGANTINVDEEKFRPEFPQPSAPPGCNNL